MRPARHFAQRRHPAHGVGLVEAVEAGIAVGVQKPATALKQRPCMLALAVRRVEVADRRRRRASPGALVPDQHP
jgi:hypothetical protein